MKDSLPLHIIKVDVEGRYEVDAILNQGVTICIIREDVWEKLGLEMNSNKQLTMKAANFEKSNTLGVIINARVYICGIEL